MTFASRLVGFGGVLGFGASEPRVSGFGIFTNFERGKPLESGLNVP